MGQVIKLGAQGKKELAVAFITCNFLFSESDSSTIPPTFLEMEIWVVIVERM